MKHNTQLNVMQMYQSKTYLNTNKPATITILHADINQLTVNSFVYAVVYQPTSKISDVNVVMTKFKSQTSSNLVV